MPRGVFKRKPQPIYERLIKRTIVDASGCWIWTGCIGFGGHGQIRESIANYSKSRLLMTHRVSWIHHRGDIPVGLFVLHKCDVPRCVNPSHLFLGTQRDNMDDMLNKERMPRGEAHYKCSLSDQDVEDIRLSTTKPRLLAEKYTVSRGYIYDIRRGARRRKAHLFHPT